MLKKIKEKPIIGYCIFTFVLFLIIGFLIPLTGDDWNNVIGHEGNFQIMINSAKYNYITFEGRFFSRIFDFIFCYYKYIWVIVNALGMTFIYYCIVKITNNKKSSYLPVLILEALLLVDEETFSQVYVWVTGNTTYFMPVIFMFIILFIKRDTFNKINVKYNKLLYVILPLLSFMFSMFVEPATVALLSVFILIIIYEFIKEKKFDWLLIICFIFSLIGFLLMIKSPGTINRSNDMNAFSNLSIIEKIIKTFPRQINYVFIKNSFLILITVFVFDTIIIKSIKGKIKWLLVTFISSLSLLTAGINFLNTLKEYHFFGLKEILNYNNPFIIIYWVIFIILCIFIVCKYAKEDNKKIMFFFLIALINNAAMLISPLAAGRTSFISTIMLYICIFILLSNINLKILSNKKIIYLNKVLCCLISVIFILYFSYCFYLNKQKENYIIKQKNEGKKEIEVIMLPGRYLWNANPWDEWHAYTFKVYYKINHEYKLKIKRIKECDL